ncbi:MAG TPA: type III secretion system cytoplasmic ring protein SctQ [Paraburkholderia sp.]
MSMPHGCTSIGDRLRCYTPALAGVSRALFDARGGLGVKPAAAQSLSSHRTARLRIGCAHGELCVCVDVSRHATLEAIALEPDADRRAALGNLWLAAPLDTLAGHGVAQPSVLDISLDAEQTDSQNAAGALHFEYGLADNPAHAAVLLEAPAPLAAALERRMTGTRAASVALPDALAAIAVPTRIRLRTRRCTTALLGSLRAGDVLLGWPRASGYAQSATLEHATVLWGAADGRAACAQARIDGHHMILETFPETMNHDPDLSLESAAGSTGETAAAERTVDLNEVELPVHIEVVTVNLPLGQIAALRPGYILTLPLKLADAEIRLVAHGQTLALGELVAVGDNLGLLIQHIANSDERHT